MAAAAAAPWVLLLALGFALSGATISNGALSTFTTPGYVVGDQPTQMVFTFRPAVAITTSGTFSITASTAVFASDAVGIAGSAYSVSNAGGSPAFSGVDITTSSTRVVFNVNSGNIVTNADTSITLNTAALGVLPAAGTTVTFTISGTGNTDQTGIAGFLTIPAPPIVLNSANLAVGTTPISLRITITSPTSLADTGTIVLTFNKAVVQSGLTNTGLVIYGTAVTSGSSTFTWTSTTTAFTFTKTGGTLSTGHTVYFDIGTNPALPNDLGAVTMGVSLGGTQIISSATGFGTIVSAASTGGDPLTIYNGNKTKFWLPLQGFFPLLRTPEIQLVASVFPGPNEDMQWFDRFIIFTAGGDKLVEVGVRRKELSVVNRTRRRAFQAGRFQQLEVTLGRSDRPLEVLKQELYSVAGGSVMLAIASRHSEPPRFHMMPQFEYVQVQTESISCVLYGSHAGTEFPNDLELQAKYVHMDFWCNEMAGVESFTGILPQIWQLEPMTDEVRAMLVPPSQIRQAAAAASAPLRICDTAPVALSA
eukprot:TRINITY_DN13810_c0_g1_i1.p1 TRINITY_DN13810_c0_g1~~TRINITY_DN13810_c0_g1_i1.p1  ORF type:complete len:551 (-),score=64.27 TRINITY_DN13810_c0_g1_i1:161-1762(-)